MSISSPLPVAAPPPASAGPPKGRSGSAPPGGDPFASVLDQQARTATAEGLDKQHDASGAQGREPVTGVPAQPSGETPAQPAADAPDPAALAAALAALLNGTAQPSAEPAVATAVPAVPVAGETAAAPSGQPLATAATVPAAVPAPATGEAVPAAAAAVPAAPVAVAATVPAAAADPQAAELPQQPAAGQAEPPTAPQGDATATATTAGNGGQTGAGDGRGAANAASRQAPTAVTDAAAPHADAQAPAEAAQAGARPAPAAQQAAAASQPASAPAAASPVAAPAAHGPQQIADALATAEPAVTHTRAATLEQAVETVRMALRASAGTGVTHARITLTPVELGSIEIHLRQTGDGIVARVVADSVTAAQLLQQSGGDLRRQLEQQGVPLLRLDIGASGEQAGQAGAQHGFGDRADGGTGSRGRGDALRDGESLISVGAEVPARARGALQLQNGVLLDVLA